jgi:uncharacterized phage-associated protein
MNILTWEDDAMGKVIMFKRGEQIMKPTVLQVANYFLKMVDRESGSSITHLKLQKLVYYAQAWHLVFSGEPLFNSKIEAWVHGPVCPELYNEFRGSGFDNLPAPEGKLYEFNQSESETLDAVWETYGSYDGKYLEDLTHQELPWTEARKGYRPGEHCTEEISLMTMREFYTKMQEEQ